MRCIVVGLCFVADMVNVGIATKTVFMQLRRSVSELNLIVLLMPHTNAVVADTIPHQIILVLLF